MKNLIVTASAILMSFASVAVDVPDLTAYRAAWAQVRPRLDASIRTNRMGALDVTVVDAEGRPVPGARVELRQRKHAFLFGCNAVVLGQMGDREAAWEAAFLKLFNLATTTFCTGVYEPARGRFRFEDCGPEVWRRPPPDRVRDFCRKNGIAMKGQPLLAGPWHPSWAGRSSEKEGKAIYGDYFGRVAERYGDALTLVDVVNESFAHWRFPLYDPAYEIEAWALAAAAPLFPKNCSLCINEISDVNGPMKQNRVWGRPNMDVEYYERVRRIRERGIRLDGVGFQFHLFSGEALCRVLTLKQWSPEELTRTYDRMASLGVPLYLTEITIPATVGGHIVGERLQAEVAENFYRFWFAHPGFSGITWWNLCDGAAWRTEGGLLGGLLDADLREKPAYQALYQLIRREWNTDEDCTTDENGRFCVRGFYGSYGARVTVAGTAESFDFDLARAGSGRRVLKLKYRLPDARTADTLARYRAGWAALRPKLDADIEANCKVNCELEIRDAAGKPVPNAKIAIRQKRHAFGFGCGAPSLGGLGERDAAYEAALVETFNLLPMSSDRCPPTDRTVAFCRDNRLRAGDQELRSEDVSLRRRCISANPREGLGKECLAAQELLASFDGPDGAGEPICIPEVTVTSIGPAGLDGEALQAEIAENLYRLLFGRRNVKGIIWQSLTDDAASKNEVDRFGGLLRYDLTRKPAYELLRKLIKETWMTSLNLETDEDGRLSFRGFRGDYEIEIPDLDGIRKLHCIPFTLSADCSNPAVVTIPCP